MSYLRNLMFAVGGSFALIASAQAAQEIEMHEVDAQGVGDSIGTVKIEDTQYGLLVTPDLTGLSPGAHGFHVHENANCEPLELNGQQTAAAAAGGHYAPDQAGTHQGPYGQGHLGDLPILMVDEEGGATTPVLAPRLKVSDLENRAVVVHEGGDTYFDHPKLGGGGSRIACGTLGK
ncbi:superoxide dismutase family protein [Halomonas sp. M20]|uniref:superoxide dismutase family protein n=1 Tax=Halomonas sp. M20 TaxID=2763264 RepID=UPI001D0B7684|nr:superoxide dismutase family protein [Halomonas sp. M20]